MEQISNNIEYKHIKDVARETIKYIDNRRKGVEHSLKTRWSKFNNLCMGGIEPNAVYAIAGISGSGNKYTNTTK